MYTLKTEILGQFSKFYLKLTDFGEILFEIQWFFKLPLKLTNLGESLRNVSSNLGEICFQI